MNFSEYQGLSICGHRDIDFVDININRDVPLYIDPERVSLSGHPYAPAADQCIRDFFFTVFDAAMRHDERKLYHLLSFGREPNETRFGLSAFRPCGRGSSPEILHPIIDDILRLRFFEEGLITELADLHLWTDNFGPDRLSDLVTNIIRGVLAEYTLEQYRTLDLPLGEGAYQTRIVWDMESHDWCDLDIPVFRCSNSLVLLVPKAFVGQQLLSTPSKLLQKYALTFRQQEHLSMNSSLCHRKELKDGRIRIDPPTKRELREKEIVDCTEKQYLRDIGFRNAEMVREMHSDHSRNGNRWMISDEDLDDMLYLKAHWAQ